MQFPTVNGHLNGNPRIFQSCVTVIALLRSCAQSSLTLGVPRGLATAVLSEKGNTGFVIARITVYTSKRSKGVSRFKLDYHQIEMEEDTISVPHPS